MSLGNRIRPLLAAVGLFVAVVPASAAASPRPPEVTALASFGSGLGSGSAIGPDGALYVTDGNAGSVLRIDRRSGSVSTYATGLPTQVLGIGGAIDLTFVGRTAYVLVTLVGGDIVGGPHIGDDIVGIYRIGRDGSPRVFADIGSWAAANPPATDFFITTGVQYAIESYRDGFLVTDGHHNRLLRVDRNGEVSGVVAFGNVVPTGLEFAGGHVYVTQAGPVPHIPEDGKVFAVEPRSGASAEVASGASMLIDVERGPGGKLYALSQGQWNGVAEGSPAFPNTGRLVVVDDDGSLTPVVDGTGAEIVLDRPTSLEVLGRHAYVVSLAGEIVRIDNL